MAPVGLSYATGLASVTPSVTFVNCGETLKATALKIGVLTSLGPDHSDDKGHQNVSCRFDLESPLMGKIKVAIVKIASSVLTAIDRTLVTMGTNRNLTT